MSLTKYSFKIVKIMIFITFRKSRNRKNLVSISSIVKNLEAVIQKLVELVFDLSHRSSHSKVLCKNSQYLQENTRDGVSFLHSYRSKVFSNKFLKNILITPIHKNHINSDSISQ